MRIIGGLYGSRKIKANIPPNVRPTSDKVRESVFNILNNLIDFDSLNVLDLFAGTGAFGFEALSRGAEFVQFVEKNRKTADIIKSVASDLSVPNDDYSIFIKDALKYLKSEPNDEIKFNLIFADPPYDKNVYTELTENLADSPVLEEDCLIVIEYRTINGLSLDGRFNILSEKTFGDTSFKILEKTTDI